MAIRLYLAENRTEYEENLIRKKNKSRTKRKLQNSYQQNLIYASMLADGGLTSRPNLQFSLSQAASPLVQGGYSHLEYLLSVFLNFPDELLTAAPLYLTSKLKKSSKTVLFWSIRLSLLNFDFFKEMYKENYYKSPTKTPEEEVALKNFAAKILKICGVTLASIEKVNNFQQLDVSKSVAPNSKNLPTTPILLEKYFKNPGLTIAHMHMQDGSLLKSTTCFLSIQTNYFDRACRLAKCIFEKTTLRYVPKIYYSTIQNKLITSLLLCQEDNAKFIALTEPYFVDCMAYKKPLVLDPNKISKRRKESMKRHVAAFNYFYANFIDPTL